MVALRDLWQPPMSRGEIVRGGPGSIGTRRGLLQPPATDEVRLYFTSQPKADCHGATQAQTLRWPDHPHRDRRRSALIVFDGNRRHSTGPFQGNRLPIIMSVKQVSLDHIDGAPQA